MIVIIITFFSIWNCPLELIGVSFSSPEKEEGEKEREESQAGEQERKRPEWDWPDSSNRHAHTNWPKKIACFYSLPQLFKFY